MKRTLLLMLNFLLVANFMIAQQSPIIYPPIQVTPAMQAAKLQNGVPHYQPVANQKTTGTNCNQLLPICTAPGAYFTLNPSINAPAAHTINPTNNYGCLGSTPNPAWFYIRIGNSGSIFLELNAMQDIDYILWGPFSSVAAAQAMCGNYHAGNTVGCSYSAANVEHPTIQNALAGQFYVLLITNFANIASPITLTQLGGNGTMNCDDLGSISGTVYNDANANCAGDVGENGLSNIYVTSGLGYASTGPTGNYTIIADSGNYTVQQIIPSYLQPLINNICTPSYSIYLDTSDVDTAGFNFYNDVLECPYLTVDISSNQRRRCFRNFTTVEYCNEGFVNATNVAVHVQFPQYVNFISANYPHTVDANGVYVFNIGNLAIGQCGTINIIDSVSCVTGIMNLPQCMEAWITPANSCVEAADTTGSSSTPWDNSSVSVTGYCIGDSIVRFVIHNSGSASNGNMQGPSEYRIYIDGALVYTGTFQIAGGADFIVEIPASGGTVRLEADQRPNHPGNSHPNDVVVGCGDPTNANALANWLAFNAQPTDDADVAIEVDCMPVLDSYDPNDKQVSPSGVTAQHFVHPNTTLDYTIRFQNTGNAVAYRVVVRDTLSADFDISTLQLGVSSHDYDFTLSGTTQPILTFDFMNINLIDSMTDPLGSQGFLKYKIAPRTATPNGTVISNRAAIYFDFNEPIITNDAWVTINDQDVLGNPINVTVISNLQKAEKQSDILAYPNPTNGLVLLDLGQTLNQCTINVLNMNGQLLVQQNADNQRFTQVDLKQFPAGLYAIQVVSETKSTILKVVRQ